jgi:hypothetical protein
LRRGFTLVEVLIAGSILVVIIIIVTGLFTTTNAAYETEVPLREAQVKAQQICDALVKEVGEGRAGMVWSAAGEAMPSGVTAPSAFVFLSARDAQGRFVMNGATMQPGWQKTIAYVPLANYPSTGTVSLSRFDFGTGSVPSTIEGYVPRLALTSAQVKLEWVPTAGGTAVLSVIKSRSAGVIQCTSLLRFSIEYAKSFTKSDGTLYTTGAWNINVTISARSSGRAAKAAHDASIVPRN